MTDSSKADPPSGRPLRLDPDAVTSVPGVPPFVAPPAGSPTYYGFPVLDEIQVEGFALGMVSDFLAEPGTDGDAFVVAPDGSRCGLIWESEVESPYFHERIAPEADRWGVWNVGLPLPMTTIEEARAYLAALLPDLRREWQAWLAAAEDPREG